MSLIIYQNPEDETKVIMMKPTGELSLRDLIDRHITTPYKVCTVEDISHLDPDFIDAWQLQEGVMTVNLTNAKNDWRNKLRQERLPLLQELDILYMRALEMNDGTVTSEIASKKQKLRDMPSHPRIEEATTTETLKGLTLEELSK